MALRNQPYLPLYVNDFMNDEKLKPCSAESIGVYIRLMCLFHKCEEYGSITFDELDERTDDICYDFATKLLPHLLYKHDVILRGLHELIARKVLTLDGETLYQKRMMNDGNLSDARARAGSAGGNAKSAKRSKTPSKHSSKNVANSDIDSDNDNETINNSSNEDTELERNLEQLNTVFDTAARSGFKTSQAELDKLNLIVADYGAEAVLRAIGICVDSGVCNLKYLRGILNKDPTGGTLAKKPNGNAPKRGKTVIEQQYNQREFTPEQLKTFDPDYFSPEEIEEIQKYKA